MADPLDVMEREIEAQGAFVPVCWRAVCEQLSAALPASLAERVERVHLVGCGDSHQAGLAASFAFGSWAGMRTEAHMALEFTSHHAAGLGPGDLVVPISNSGKVARTVEAAVMARGRGARVLAVTGQPEGRLAQESDAVIGTGGAQTVGLTPGTHSFVASLVTVWCLAHHLAVVRGRGDSPGIRRAESDIGRMPTLCGEMLSRCRTIPEGVIDLLSSSTLIQVLGAGPAWAMAQCAQMKFLEAAAVTALPFELEEWAHSGFFLTEPTTPLLLLAPAGRSLFRAKEIIQAAVAMGASVIAVVPDDRDAAWEKAVHVIAIPGDVDELLSPLPLALSVQMLALHAARRLGATPLGFDSARRREVNFEQIFGSEIRCEPPGGVGE
ncbi:SIS domain-containing protein [Candidatus Sumerlaeota bacterium]|nr:SIS domain-containing protein [Candidatus Sumerlaeota bacterium]